MGEEPETPDKGIQKAAVKVEEAAQNLELLPYEAITQQIQALQESIEHLTNVVNGLKGGRPRANGANIPILSTYLKEIYLNGGKFGLTKDGRMERIG